MRSESEFILVLLVVVLVQLIFGGYSMRIIITGMSIKDRHAVS